jgi:hypothetical protein
MATSPKPSCKPCTKMGTKFATTRARIPALSTISSAQLTSETSGAQQDLQGWGYNPATFAYPYDDYGGGSTSAVVDAVKASGVRGARDSDYGGYNNPISVPSSVIQGVVNYIVQNGVHVVTDSEGLVIQNLNAQQ